MDESLEGYPLVYILDIIEGEEPKIFQKKMLREKEYYILINLRRRKHTYLYSSVRAKKETKLRV